MDGRRDLKDEKSDFFHTNPDLENILIKFQTASDCVGKILGSL